MKTDMINPAAMDGTDNVKDIISYLPVGICAVQLDDELTLLHGNGYFYDLYGYTAGQMKAEFDNKILRLVHRDDRDFIRKMLEDAQDKGQKGFEAEHRISRRDGSVVWGLVSGTFVEDERGRIAACVVIDITRRKKIEEELRINEERFRIALTQVDNTIFDYDIKTRVMIHADKSAEMYGLAHRTENVPDSLVANGVVHPDTAKDFLEMYGKIRAGIPSASCEIMTHIAEGDYLWRKITMTNIFDDQGNPVRAVGMLEDIDRQKRREEKLRNRSERDPLTGLYNKGAAERYIKQALAEASGTETGAFYVIDVDDFKRINDRYGHLYGDKFLAETGSRIVNLFRAKDIAGRIGGDEFVLFVNNIKDENRMRERAEALCRALQEDFESNGIISRPFCSIGGAFYPKDGTDFETLYQKADIALYEAKRSGKRQAKMYREEMKKSVSGGVHEPADK